MTVPWQSRDHHDTLRVTWCDIAHDATHTLMTAAPTHGCQFPYYPRRARSARGKWDCKVHECETAVFTNLWKSLVAPKAWFRYLDLLAESALGGGRPISLG